VAYLIKGVKTDALRKVKDWGFTLSADERIIIWIVDRPYANHAVEFWYDSRVDTSQSQQPTGAASRISEEIDIMRK